MNVLIIDDEPPAREELRRLLEAEENVTIIGECANALEGISAINRLSPDAIFLDIHMPRVSGFEMLTMLDPDRMPHVVFLTAYSEYALKAFEENATDYLLKPADPERLKKTLQRLRDSGTSNPALFEPEKPLAQIPCTGLNRIFLVKVSSVECAISRASGVYIVDLEGRERFTELTLKTLEERTPLIRCHRQVLINPEAINEIVFHDSGLAEIVTTGERKVPVSRRFLKSLKERLAIT